MPLKQPRRLPETKQKLRPKQASSTKKGASSFLKEVQLSETPSTTKFGQETPTNQNIVESVNQMLAQNFHTYRYPDFASECHFVLRNYSCTHKLWQKDPKITHVGLCDVQNHKVRCGNMAKFTRESWFDKACDGCEAGKKKTSMVLDHKMAMVDAVNKELEKQKNGPGWPLNLSSSKVGFEHKMEEVVDKLTAWNLKNHSSLQPPPIFVTKAGAVAWNPGEYATVVSVPVSGSDATPEKPMTLIENYETSTKVTELETDKEEVIEEKEEFQLVKPRKHLLAFPGDKNGAGIADYPKGILNRASNAFFWKSRTRYVEKGKVNEKKTGLDSVGPMTGHEDDDLWKDEQAWVHISSNVERK